MNLNLAELIKAHQIQGRIIQREDVECHEFNIAAFDFVEEFE